MEALVAALDCGTTAVKAGIFDLRGRTRGAAGRLCPCVVGEGGLVEQDADGIVAAALAALREALARSGARPSSVGALAVSTQRATVVCAGRRGDPLARAVSWQDMRGAADVETFARDYGRDRYFARTGLPPHPVFTLAKLLRLRREAPSLFSRAAAFCLVHDFVLRRLGARGFFCDLANASLTGLLDPRGLRWDASVLAMAGIGEERLGRLVPSGAPVGALSTAAAARCGLAAGTPLAAGGGDQQCAGVGAGAVAEGVAELTVGTAAATLCPVGRFVEDPRRAVTCCVHAVPGTWEVEGLQNSAGSSVQWLVRGLWGRAPARGELGRLIARAPAGAGGAVYYPYLAGGAAPHWRAGARGVFAGLSLATGREALLRAVVEGVTMETREVLDALRALGVRAGELRLTGGYSDIPAWNAIRADLLGRPVVTLRTREASLLGAAVLAACGAGAFPSVPAAAAAMVRIKETCRPDRERRARYDALYRRWRAALRGIHRGRVFESLSL